MTPDERKALVSEIVEVMNSTKPQLSDEEMQWVRLAIEAESRKIRFRDAVIEKTIDSRSKNVSLLLSAIFIPLLSINLYEYNLARQKVNYTDREK